MMNLHQTMCRTITSLLLFMSLWSAACASTYYVDSARGKDGNDGLSLKAPFQSLKRVRDLALLPGDTVLLTAGSVWREPLVVQRSGSQQAPIFFGVVGIGPRPIINSSDVSEYGIAILNAEYVSISGFEISNEGLPVTSRYGVLISAENFGVAHGINVSDLYIHDIRGTNDRKDNGGIVFRALGRLLPTRFEGLTIERNVIWRVDRSGIAGISDQVALDRWFPSRGVIIRDNYLEDIGGDGIVPRGTDGALIEHNIVRHAASRAPGYHVAIWQWSTDNSLIQLNEAAFTHGRYDGQGFDSDFNSRGTRIIFNYSHDNEGGFVLICTPAIDGRGNIGNTGTVIRSNVSRNDGTRIFQLAGPISDVLIEDNVIDVGSKQDVKMVVATQWQGWPTDVRFQKNSFAVSGTARYGHEIGRDGPNYLIAPQFTPTKNIRFRGNRFLGRHIDPPADEKGHWRRDYQAPDLDWNVPVFDPSQPTGFPQFMLLHRDRMLRMLSRELGKTVRLSTPEPTPSSEFRTKTPAPLR